MVARDVNMLEAKKNRFFEQVFRIYNSNLLRRKFDSFRVAGLERLQKEKSKPKIILANHTGWWDGLVAFDLSMRAGLDGYVMMEEKHLKRFWPFTRLGAFSVVRENAREAVKSIRYAAEILKEDPRRSLWIFPQGEIVPFGARPMRLFPGFARVIERIGECQIVTMTMRYELMKAHRPTIAVSIDEPFSARISGKKDRENLVTKITERLCAGEDKLDAIMSSGNIHDEFENILR